MEGVSRTDFGLADFLTQFLHCGFEIADFLGGFGEDGDFVLADGNAGGLERIEPNMRRKTSRSVKSSLMQQFIRSIRFFSEILCSTVRMTCTNTTVSLF